MNNTKRCKVYRNNTKRCKVCGNTEQCREGPCSDVMGYITIITHFLTLLPMSSIFVFFLGFISIKSVISRFLLDLLCSGAISGIGTYRTRHPLDLPLEGCSRLYSNTTSLFGSSAFYLSWTWAPWLCISCFQTVCPLYLSPSWTCYFETCRRKLFHQFSIVFKSLFCMSMFWLVW